MDITSAALQGLQQANTQLDHAATKIASIGATSGASGADNVDLSAEVLALMASKNQYSANLGSLKVADEVSKSTLDMMA